MTMSSACTSVFSHGPNARERSSAGSARLPTMTGCTNSTETCCASVAYGPRPKASKRPPRRKRSDISRQAVARFRDSREKKPSMISLRASSRSSICAPSLEAVCIALANPWQRIPDQHVDNPAAAISCGHEHCAGGLGLHLADDECVFAAIAAIQSVECGVGVLGRDHGEKLTFVRDVQRIQPQQFTGAPDFVAHGDLLFRQ